MEKKTYLKLIALKVGLYSSVDDEYNFDNSEEGKKQLLLKKAECEKEGLFCMIVEMESCPKIRGGGILNRDLGAPFGVLLFLWEKCFIAKTNIRVVNCLVPLRGGAIDHRRWHM